MTAAVMIMMPVMTAAVFAMAMMTAIMIAMFVVMTVMIAFSICIESKFTRCICFCRSFHRTRNTGIKCDACFRKGDLCTSADTAADQRFSTHFL